MNWATGCQSLHPVLCPHSGLPFAPMRALNPCTLQCIDACTKVEKCPWLTVYVHSTQVALTYVGRNTSRKQAQDKCRTVEGSTLQSVEKCCGKVLVVMHRWCQLARAAWQQLEQQQQQQAFSRPSTPGVSASSVPLLLRRLQTRSRLLR